MRGKTHWRWKKLIEPVFIESQGQRSIFTDRSSESVFSLRAAWQRQAGLLNFIGGVFLWFGGGSLQLAVC